MEIEQLFTLLSMGILCTYYACSLLFLEDRILARQKIIMRKIRGKIRQFTGIAITDVELTEEDQKNSFQVFSLCFSIAMLWINLSLIYDGKVLVSLNVLFINGLYTLVCLYCSPRYVIIFARSLMMHQLVFVWTVFKATDTLAMCRAALIRAFIASCLFVRLDEICLNMMMMTFVHGYKFGWNERLVFLPLRLLLLFNIPIAIFGVREWLSNPKNSFRYWQTRKSTFHVALSVVLLTIFLSFSSPQDPSQTHTAFALLVGALHFIVFGFMYVSRGYYMQEYTTQMAIFSKDKRSLTYFPSTPSLDFVFGSTAFLCLLLPSPFFASLSILMFCAARFSSTKVLSDSMYRPLVMLHHIGMIVWILTESSHTSSVLNFDSAHTWKQTASILYLAAARLVLAFDLRSISDVQRDLALASMCTVWLNNDPQAVLPFAFLSICAPVVATLVFTSRQYSVALMKKEGDSQAFLSHALKQKFTGIAGATDHILTAMKKVGDSEIELRDLFRGILQECKNGQQACHAVTIIRNIKSGIYLSVLTSQSLKTTLQKWTAEGMPVVPANKFLGYDDCAIDFKFDWDLMRIFLFLWTRKSNLLLVTATLVDTTNVKIIFKSVGNKVSRIDMTSCEVLAMQLNGKLDCYLNSFTVYSVLEKTGLANNLGIQDRSSPLNLRFAMLDDNLLVRKNIDLTMRLHLDADPDSFIRGEAIEECYSFAEEIIRYNVDIAIFDENLEFGEITIKGSDIARAARKLGYAGCAISYSAGSETKGDPAFDGVVEKTFSRTDFVSGVILAWNAFLLTERGVQARDQQLKKKLST